MENFKLVLEVLERGPNSIEALGFPNGGIVIVVETKVLDENKTSGPGNGVVGGGSGGLLPIGLSVKLDGAEEVSSGDGVNGVAKLVVQVPDLLQDSFDFVNLHFPFHLRNYLFVLSIIF